MYSKKGKKLFVGMVNTKGTRKSSSKINLIHF